MTRRSSRVATSVLVFSVAASSSSSATFDKQDSPASQPPAATQATGARAQSGDANAPPEPKKVKKVWTNENLTEVSSSPVSQIGDVPNGSSGKSAAAKPVSSQQVAGFRKQLAAYQAQLLGIDNQIADLKGFSKGEVSRANGLQLHRKYTMEPVQDQIAKLEERRKSVAAQMDAVLDAARKQGIDAGQLR